MTEKRDGPRVSTFEDFEKELMKDWRFRLLYYIQWPYYQAIIIRIRLKNYIRKLLQI